MPLFVTMEVPASPDAIAAACEGLASLNFKLMRTAQLAGGGFPPLYRSGIVYRRESPRKENWQNVIQLLRTREGDCEDLAGYRVGELRMEGEPATIDIVPTSRGSYHAVVRRGDGTREDPSRILLAIERERKGL
jgi:hypothetical protein